MALAPATRLGAYEILAPLGAGGTAAEAQSLSFSGAQKRRLRVILDWTALLKR